MVTVGRIFPVPHLLDGKTCRSTAPDSACVDQACGDLPVGSETLSNEEQLAVMRFVGKDEIIRIVPQVAIFCVSEETVCRIYCKHGWTECMCRLAALACKSPKLFFLSIPCTMHTVNHT